MDYLNQFLDVFNFGKPPQTQFQSTLDDEAFNSLPVLVIHQIFMEIPEEEIMELRAVSKLWNNYILAWHIFELEANDDNWDLVTAINARNIHLYIPKLSKSISTDHLNVDFSLGIKELDVDQLLPKQLYHILSSTKNLETLYLRKYLRKPFTNADSAWAENLQIPEAEQTEWLKKLRYFKMYGRTELQPLRLIRKLLAPCQISEFYVRNRSIKNNEIFPSPCFNYGLDYNPRNCKKVSSRFIRYFLDDHKATIKKLILKKMDGEMKIKFDYDPESETNQLRIKKLSVESVSPLRELDDPTHFRGILDVIKSQTSIKTLKIKEYDGVIDTVEYRDLLLDTIFPNNSTTLTKLEIYTLANNPQTDRIYWKGFMFSTLHSLQSLCLRSNQTVRLQVLDQIELLPPSLTVLKTSFCISFPFGIIPSEKTSLEDFFPNLEKLHVESIPWFGFNDGAMTVKAIDNNLISFLSNFKNLKKWKFASETE